MTEAWSCNHFQPKMGLLGSAGRMRERERKKIKFKYASYGFFFSCFHEQKFNFSNFFLHFSICTKKWLRMNDFLKIRKYFLRVNFFLLRLQIWS